MHDNSKSNSQHQWPRFQQPSRNQRPSNRQQQPMNQYQPINQPLPTVPQPGPSHLPSAFESPLINQQPFALPEPVAHPLPSPPPFSFGAPINQQWLHVAPYTFPFPLPFPFGVLPQQFLFATMLPQYNPIHNGQSSSFSTGPEYQRMTPTERYQGPGPGPSRNQGFRKTRAPHPYQKNHHASSILGHTQKGSSNDGGIGRDLKPLSTNPDSQQMCWQVTPLPGPQTHHRSHTEESESKSISQSTFIRLCN